MSISKSSLNGLTDKSDLELIRMVKEDANSIAFSTICLRYEDIFYKVCHKYDKRITAAGLNCQDIFEEMPTIIFHCVTTFDPSKNAKLGTWIGNFARYLCLNSINSRKHISPSCDEDVHDMIERHQSYTPLKENTINDKAYIANILRQIKDPRISEIIKLRYLSEKKIVWSEVANIVGVSVQTAINLSAKGLKLLKKKITSKDFSDTI